ncbi:MAG: flagellar biosynthesis protein FlgJ [Clostridiaceae bacterium]|mgnify:CR=1 FL=1|jgi:flagellar protein FlgJ|nr:flagellar biosynthesis protein FlgJ [Clostridiaceae bacterium]
MKIDGLGQSNYTEMKASSSTTDAADFETALKKAYDEGDMEKLKEACDGFESIMLKSLFEKMKATVPVGGLFEKSAARSMFEDMLDDELVKEATKRGVGISDMMYRQLSAQMERAYKYERPDTDTSQAALQDTESEEVEAAEEIIAEEGSTSDIEDSTTDN